MPTPARTDLAGTAEAARIQRSDRWRRVPEVHRPEILPTVRAVLVRAVLVRAVLVRAVLVRAVPDLEALPEWSMSPRKLVGTPSA